MSGKALMTQYAEGSLVSHELHDMMAKYAADARFDREMVDDIDLYNERKAVLIHKGNPKGLIKRGLEP